MKYNLILISFLSQTLVDVTSSVTALEGHTNALAHGSPKRPKYEKNCPGRTPYFLKRVYPPEAFKNGKMKMYHSCPKE